MYKLLIRPLLYNNNENESPEVQRRNIEVVYLRARLLWLVYGLVRMRKACGVSVSPSFHLGVGGTVLRSSEGETLIQIHNPRRTRADEIRRPIARESVYIEHCTMT